MAKQKIEIEVDVPAGFRLVGYRKAKCGEYYIDDGRAFPVTSAYGTAHPWPILEKLEPEIRTGFINVYPHQFHSTKEAAEFARGPHCITTVEVKYEVPPQ